MRVWVLNDTEVRREPDADNGFEVEMVHASDYDELVRDRDELVRRMKEASELLTTLKTVCDSQAALIRNTLHDLYEMRKLAQETDRTQAAASPEMPNRKEE